MLDQLLVGGLVSACNIVIHALIMTLVVRAAQTASTKHTTRPHLRLILVMVVTILGLEASHSSEVFVWALAYWIFDVAPAGANLVYFAFVNYTTLGYGDVLPAERWQLLGPMAAMNGVLLFGWSTAVIFEVLRKTLALGSVAGRAR